MGLALQVILLLAISVTFFVQGSAGSNISPSPSLLTVIPPILGLPVIPIDVNAPSPASLPNVSQIPPLLPPVNSTPVPETGTGKVIAPTLSPNTSPPSTGHELVPPPVANTSPPSPGHELVPPPVANTSPPSPGHELVPPPVESTSPPSPGHELVLPPVANAPRNQDPINDSPKPVPIAPGLVTTPPSSSPQKPPSVDPLIPRLRPPSSTPKLAPANKAPPFNPQAPEPVISTVSPPPPNPSTIPPPNPSTIPPPNPSTIPPPNPSTIPPPNPSTIPPPNPSTILPPNPSAIPPPSPRPSPSKGTDGTPVASPPKRKFQPISPQNSPPLKAPPVHKSNASSPKNNVAPLSPPVIRPQAPASLPSIPSRHDNDKKNITLSPPSSLQFPPPPVTSPTLPPIQRDAFSPKSHSHSRQKSHAAPPSLSPSTKDDHLPGSLPPQTSPPRQTPLPFPSPKASPSAPSPSHMKRPVLPPIHALPPPPPNKDCSPLTCKEPYTNTPPGSPCGCVWPMQVGLRLGVALYTFFPLVSELAEEISIGAFMRQSQVRIMGANAANQDPEKTIVLIDLVPLGEKFDNTTAFLTADRFWNKQVAIHSLLFGNYEVLYVRYPGLPPSPPSSVNIVDGEPYLGHGDNGRSVKPLGVDVKGVHHKRNQLSGSVVAIIALSASFVLVLSIAVFWVVLSKRRQCQQGPTPPLATLAFLTKPSGLAGSIVESLPSSEMLSIPSTMAPYTGSAKTFSSTDIDKATDSFNSARVLGEGGFGRVYSGVLSDGTEVAVKVLKRDDQQGGREFLAEVEMLSRLHHRNLVKLIGICTEDRARCLVYEIVRNGSVESHLHGVDKDIAPLDWSSRLKIALGAARGLAYLHEDSSPRVIHRDFKSSNILLEDDFTPKVSDFGLARTAFEEENKHVSTRVMGTFGYVAPEYAMTGHLLVKSDVYSYGVVLLELLTGKKPVDMSQPPGRENLVSWVRPLLTNQEDLETIIDPSLGPDFPFDSIAKVSAIASMCVQPEVSHRPFMGEVVQALKLVCTEGDMANNLESRSCSHEDLLDTQSPVSNYDYGLDVESGYSGSESDIYRFKRLEKQDDGSFRRHSSSGPLRTERGDKVRDKLRRFSSGTVSEHRTKPRFWSGSH